MSKLQVDRPLARALEQLRQALEALDAGDVQAARGLVINAQAEVYHAFAAVDGREYLATATGELRYPWGAVDPGGQLQALFAQEAHALAFCHVVGELEINEAGQPRPARVWPMIGQRAVLWLKRAGEKLMRMAILRREER